MIRELREKWRQLWRTANDWALAMDTSPLDDLYDRVRRLEAVTFRSESDKDAGAPEFRDRAAPG
jgi:hypothetical protein